MSAISWASMMVAVKVAVKVAEQADGWVLTMVFRAVDVKGDVWVFQLVSTVVAERERKSVGSKVVLLVGILVEKSEQGSVDEMVAISVFQMVAWMDENPVGEMDNSMAVKKDGYAAVVWDTTKVELRDRK